jgi:1,4-dihydroxy-2-naphthoate octaprenyltransferase
VVLSGEWWLLLVGVAAILAAWFYTGGSHPYGYLGRGEVMVFGVFGRVAVVGTTYVQSDAFSLPALYAAVGIGALACAILVANNLRDIPTDHEVGKRTLAVVLGDERTRGLYALLVGVALVALVGVALGTSPWAALGALGLLVAARATRTVLGGAHGRDLVPVLQLTGLAELLYGAGILVGLLVGR